MTTENGLTKLQHARRSIEVLRDRAAYLEAKIEQKWPDGEPPESFERAEVRAIEWALPILEAEWDSLARMRREVLHLENRRDRLRLEGVDIDSHPFAWASSPTPALGERARRRARQAAGQEAD